MQNYSPFGAYPPAPASQEEFGLIELATDAETIAGTAINLATTPANIAAKLDGGASDVTLSGTPKIFCVKDSSGTPYYFKAYPTKA